MLESAGLRHWHKEIDEELASHADLRRPMLRLESFKKLLNRLLERVVSRIFHHASRAIAIVTKPGLDEDL
ncbi:hypothetical protein GCM10027052_05320 [Parafrigoribacterium mesophilum]